ncbi:hypothetical protein VNI00_003595 [Paramarasmius palmivorus]|uniref:Uncharacterized protein n=1 Tax=Paramarasmius palmivorus TaxID=297713 RepID=A0AAW0DRF5_9AGAR
MHASPNVNDIPESPLSTTSTLFLDDDQIRSIFLTDKLVFEQSPVTESDIPPNILACIADILDQPDIYDAIFGSPSDLDPTAQPFVPQSQTSPDLDLESPLEVIPSWEAVLNAACIHQRPTLPILSSYATELVVGAQWNAEELAELARQLCWKVSSPTSGANRDALAPFARELYLCFASILGQETASCFLGSLQTTVMELFRNSWCTEINQTAISYLHPPSTELLASAISITSFIGDMFAHDLYPKTQICVCISVIVHELYSVEHLEALRVLIEHSQAGFWCVTDNSGQMLPIEGMFRKFLSHFAGKIEVMKHKKQLSVIGRATANSQERDGKVREILDMLSGWLGRDVRQL